MFHVRQCQDPTNPNEEWRKQVVLCKYQACDSDKLNTTTKRPIQSLEFRVQSFETVIRNINRELNYGEKTYGRLHPKLQRAHASGVSSEAIPPWSSRSLRDFIACVYTGPAEYLSGQILGRFSSRPKKVA